MKREGLIIGTRPRDIVLPGDLRIIQVELTLLERVLARIDTNEERAVGVGAWTRVRAIRIHGIRVHHGLVEVVAPSSETIGLPSAAKIRIFAGKYLLVLRCFKL